MGVRSTGDDAFSGHLCQKTTGLAILISGAFCRAHTRPGKMRAHLRTAPFSWRWRLPNRPVFDNWERFGRQRKGRGGANKPGASGRAQASPGARGRGGAGRLQSARGKRRQAPPPAGQARALGRSAPGSPALLEVLGGHLQLVDDVDALGAHGLAGAAGDAVFVNKEIDISLCRFSTLRWQAPTHLPS